MTATKQKPELTSAQAATIHLATGLSSEQQRRLLKANRRPTNPVTAAAWDEVIADLGLAKGAAK